LASGTTEFIDITTADAFLEEVWATKATISREAELAFIKYGCDRQFEGELQKGQILRIQNISDLAARAKVANTAISYETVTETEKTITIDQFYYAAYAMEDVIKPMVQVSKLDAYTGKIGYALGLGEDDYVSAFVDDGDMNTVGTLATPLTYSNLLRGDQYLNDANAPQQDRLIISSPAEKANFLGMDEFIATEYAKVQGSTLVGSWMNYPIYVSTNVEGTNAAGHDNFMGHKECIAQVTQIKPIVKAFWDIDYFCVKMAALTTYAGVVRRPDHGVWLKGG